MEFSRTEYFQVEGRRYLRQLYVFQAYRNFIRRRINKEPVV